MGFWAKLFGIDGHGTRRSPATEADVNAARAARHTSRREALPHIDGTGAYEFDIVGEAQYQDNLAQIAGGKTEDGHEFECRAVLCLEPSNPYDSNAIRVDINGLTVGYIPRDYAPGMSSIIRSRAGSGRISLDAIIVGGWSRRSGEGNFGVKLDLGDGDE